MTILNESPSLEKLFAHFFSPTPYLVKTQDFFLELQMSSDRFCNPSTYLKFGGKIIKHPKIDQKNLYEKKYFLRRVYISSTKKVWTTRKCDSSFVRQDVMKVIISIKSKCTVCLEK